MSNTFEDVKADVPAEKPPGCERLNFCEPTRASQFSN
jgi:hypothetical protein